MTLSRKILLSVGPVFLVGICYTVSMRGGVSHADLAVRVPTDSVDMAVEEFDALAPKQPSGTRRPTGAAPASGLRQRCLDRAHELQKQLGGSFNVVVSPPFVLLADTELPALQRLYSNTIVPSVRALENSYFDTPPTSAVAIVLLSDEDAFRSAAKKLDQRPVNNLYGYYLHSQRRMLVNLATGNGSLAHELTHALSKADFPTIPEWFDEGLASLHEQSHFSDDGLQLIGTSNWRLYYLLQAERNGQLRPVSQLLAYRNIRPGNEEIDYAHARYFCLYLQQQGLLADFYRVFRDGQPHDDLGLHALTTLLAPHTLDEIDVDFRNWLSELRDQIAAGTHRN